MNAQFPVTRSILSAEALQAYLFLNYDVGNIAECKFLTQGLNDSYLVRADSARYILRAYRSGWRSASEIEFEIEALLHLQQSGVSVSTPLIRRDGKYIEAIMAPEGMRFLVLFSYALGKEPTYGTNEIVEALLYGKMVARIHKETNTFRSKHSRFTLDLTYLLDNPLEIIKPFFSNRVEDLEYLVGLAEKLRQHIKSMPINSLDFGFCHGDLHGQNAHIDQDKAITFFDFDCCGMGWRAYDIAVFRWGSLFNNKSAERYASFMRGYNEIRCLCPIDLDSIPYFVVLRQIWYMGLHAGCKNDFGFGGLNERFFDRQLKLLRDCERGIGLKATGSNR